MENNSEELLDQAAALSEQGKYAEAIACYDKIPEADEMYFDAQYRKGWTLYMQGKYAEAIACYDKIPETHELYFATQYGKGMVLFVQAKYPEAIACYDKIPEADVLYIDAQLCTLRCYVKTKDEIIDKDKKIKECFARTKNTDVFEILADYLLEIDEKMELIGILLDYDFSETKGFFWNTLDKGKIAIDSDEYKSLKKIYLQSLKIICLLHVTNKEKNRVAHYTTLSASGNLMLKKSPLRMGSEATANDPSEGKILLQSLGLHLNDKGENADFVAFMACFSFNTNQLNQFRLYGKSENKEATGLSLVVNMDLFSRSITDSTRMRGVLGELMSKEEADKAPTPDYALFRCLYLDPSSQQIISIGRRDIYSFYLDDSEGFKKRYNEYKEAMNKVIKDLQTELDRLRELITQVQAFELDSLLNELLIQLRYLTKHAAFKEEQECRILVIKNVRDPESKIEFNPEYSSMYIDYKVIADYVDQIVFAPNAEQYAVMSAAFKKENPKVECFRSTHPLA